MPFQWENRPSDESNKEKTAYPSKFNEMGKSEMRSVMSIVSYLEQSGEWARFAWWNDYNLPNQNWLQSDLFPHLLSIVYSFYLKIWNCQGKKKYYKVYFYFIFWPHHLWLAAS